MASTAMSGPCRWQVAGGRWCFDGSHKAEFDEVDDRDEETTNTDINGRWWHATNGRWSYACDGPMPTDEGRPSADNAGRVAEGLQESPWRALADLGRTTEGPHSTPGEPLCFLSSAAAVSPQDIATAGTELAGALQLQVDDDNDSDDDNMEMLEAVEPMLPEEFCNDTCLPTESVQAAFVGPTSTWKRISPMRTIPSAARQMSAKAHKAKGHVSEKMHRSLGYVKTQTEGTLRVPVHVSETMHRSIGFVKGQTGSALKVPGQMSETAQKGLGYAKTKAMGIARGMHRTTVHSGGA